MHVDSATAHGGANMRRPNNTHGLVYDGGHKLDGERSAVPHPPRYPSVALDWRAMTTILVLAFLGVSAWTLATASAFQPVTPPLDLPVDIQTNWAQYAPYFPAAKYPPPAGNCKLTQVSTQCSLSSYPWKKPHDARQVNIVSVPRTVERIIVERGCSDRTARGQVPDVECRSVDPSRRRQAAGRPDLRGRAIGFSQNVHL